MNKAIKVLKSLEWCGQYGCCTGWPCCPICGGIKPGLGRHEFGNLPVNQGHHPNCKLADAIKLDEEKK